MPRIQFVYNSNLYELHNPVSQVIAAKIRIPILIGSIYFNLVSNPPVPNPERTGAKIRGSAPAVDNQRLVLLAILIIPLPDHSGYGVIQRRYSLIDHIPFLYGIFRKDF